MRQDGMLKVLTGVTTVSEVDRVASDLGSEDKKVYGKIKIRGKYAKKIKHRRVYTQQP